MTSSYFNETTIRAKLDALNATYDEVAGQKADYMSVEELTLSNKKLEALREEMMFWEQMLSERSDNGRRALRVIRLRNPSGG